MRTHYLFVAGLLAVAMAPAADVQEPSIDTAAAFSKLKSLAGEWAGDSPMGKAHMSIQVIAGGTAVVERETMEGMPEMMTVYHTDGKRLLLTHYCMAGNQPRMQAASYSPSSGELRFRFLDATNLASPAAGHMHNANFRFVDGQHLITEWQFYENGQVKNAEKAEYTKVR
jgi:hypothetical protein